MGKNKQWKQALLIWSVLALVVYLLIKSEEKAYSELEANGVLTEGKFIGFGKKNSVKWEYKINGHSKIIIDKNKKLQGFKQGEVYEAVFDPNDLKNANLDYSKPITNWFAKDTIDKVEILNGGVKSNNLSVTVRIPPVVPA